MNKCQFRLPYSSSFNSTGRFEIGQYELSVHEILLHNSSTHCTKSPSIALTTEATYTSVEVQAAAQVVQKTPSHISSCFQCHCCCCSPTDRAPLSTATRDTDLAETSTDDSSLQCTNKSHYYVTIFIIIIIIIIITITVITQN